MSTPRTVTILGLFLCVAAAAHAASSTSDPDFFWLPPAVATSPSPAGPFDATALHELAVDGCELDDSGACVAGPSIEHFTSAGTPVPQRLRLDEAGEFYTVDWLTGRSHARRDVLYRVRVTKGDVELGFVDVDLVQNTPELASVDTSRYIGLVRGQHLTIRFRIQHPTARTRVTINEIESSNGVPGDWVELFNSASTPVSLANYIVKDNDDTHVYTLPSGTTIPANGYFVVEEAALGFGLGAAD